MELIQVGTKTYYIKNNTNIGIYLINEKDVFIIDTGNDKEAGKKILKIIENHGWSVKGIINTHSNADHIGGNKVIQDRTQCPIFTSQMEACFTKYPIFEPSFLYGGYPLQDLQNKFLMAKASETTELKSSDQLPDGLEYFSLKGHFVDMIGIKTSDNVYFLADSLFSEQTISKYHVFFLYDVQKFLDSLDLLNTLEGALYIPSHCEATNNITGYIEQNRSKVIEIAEKIKHFCKEGKTFEEILQFVFDTYHLKMDIQQYVLIGSTIRSYLSYLHDQTKINYEFQNNKMIWKQI